LKFLAFAAPVTEGNETEPEGLHAPPHEAWFSVEVVSSAEEMDRKLARPEYFGWLHEPGASAEVDAAVIARAVKFVGRQAVVFGPRSSATHSFLRDVGERDSALFIVLPKYEAPGRQLLQR
jgi:hypothetical protein